MAAYLCTALLFHEAGIPKRLIPAMTKTRFNFSGFWSLYHDDLEGRGSSLPIKYGICMKPQFLWLFCFWWICCWW